MTGGRRFRWSFASLTFDAMHANGRAATLLAALEQAAPLTPRARQALLIQANLEASERWTPSRISSVQARQLTKLMTHAYAAVEHYRKALEAAGFEPGAPFSWDCWRRLPLVTREHVQVGSGTLRANRLPAGHRIIGTLRTSGSTGRAVEVLTTNVHDTWQKVLMLRGQIWADRDFSATMAIIRKVPHGRAGPPVGDRRKGWAHIPFPSGPCVRLTATAEIGEQRRWLEQVEPDYLTTYPSILRELAASPLSNRSGRPSIKGVNTLGETVDEDLRELVAQNWNCRIFDIYSTEEVGCIALQCPVSGGYHVQAEAVLVEILDEDGNPCRPGENGRVVVTPLFNFAMPLLRYVIGDYAREKEQCSCGRNLPFLERILGRQRNMLVLADGRRYWPTFGTRDFAKIAPIRQQQFHQVAYDRLEVRLVVDEPLRPEQEAAVKAKIQNVLPAPFHIALHYVDSIPRNAGGKFELFTSAIAAQAGRPATLSA